MRVELIVNGSPQYKSGIPDHGVLNVILSWVKRHPDAFDPERHGEEQRSSFCQEALDVQATGIDTPTAESASHLAWPKKELQVGDEITIRILAPGDVDEPEVLGGR
jgi:hypothetical protein